MIDKMVGDLDAAMAGIGAGASIMISGFGNAGIPVTLLRALGAMVLSGLTLIVNAARRIDQCEALLFGEGRVEHVVTTAFRGPDAAPASFEGQWKRGELTLEILPQGTFAERIRAGGAGIPAFYSPTAVGTNLAEGREQRDFNGRTYVLEEALTADFALLRAQKADRYGNLYFRGTQANFGPAMATAARTTIVEVEEISETSLPPEDIHLPGIYVQRVLQAPRLDPIS
ncbi:MAG: 3-oxoacid CoA-transferase subunit A [Alphaproteobacteria bacterium]|jgi:3-oxoacid CoA-transferase A subunit|nr:3-oxoacid CoA-transferase subunit A [Alphaproteobacteria bacterium]